MTVKELRDELSKLPYNTEIVVSWTDDTRIRHFEIDGVSLRTGTPSRNTGGQPQFKVDSDGLVTWLFISISLDE